MSGEKPTAIKEEYHWKHTETRVPGQPAQHSYQQSTTVTPPEGLPITTTSASDKSGRWFPFRRAPVEEASIPQPRPEPDHDSYNDPTVADRLKEHLNHISEKTKETAKDAVEGVKRTADKAADRAERLGEKVGNKLHGMKEDVTEGLHHVRSEVREKIDDLKTHHHHEDPAELSKEFVEGAEMAKKQAFKRFNSLAAETHRKIVEADRAASQWEQQSRAEVNDAWESAKTHTDSLLKRFGTYSNYTFSDALKEVRADNIKLEHKLFQDVCDRHPQKAQCYKSVEKLMEVARDNTRINIQLAADKEKW